MPFRDASGGSAALPASAIPSSSAVSWAAIIAGAVVASALALMLAAVGSGIGLASISPFGNRGVSATTFGVLGVAWFVAIQLFASGVGGYIAGRLRTRWPDAQADEVYFRDTAHGFLVWAIGTLVTVTLVGSALTSAVSGAAQVGGAALGGIGSAAVSTAAGAAGGASGSSDQTAYLTDVLFRSDRPAAQTDVNTARAEAGRIIVRSLAAGTVEASDRTYLAGVIARETGISQTDAEKRIDDVVDGAKAAAQKAADTAKAAAEQARKIGIQLALWAFVGLLVGAFSASFMAMVGGRLRDE